MNIDWTVLGNISAYISITVAIIALVIQGQRSRIAQQSDLLLKYYDKFYNTEMRKLRESAARNLIAGKSPNYDLEDVLDYFGIIGVLHQRGVLDYELTYRLFDYWILRYWFCAKRYVEARRQDPKDADPEMWSYLEQFVNGLLVYRKKKGSVEITEEGLHRFLQEEARTES